MKSMRHFPWRALWTLTRPYWFSEERWSARGLLAAVVTLSLTEVYLSVLFNDWYKLFYDALQQYDLTAFWHQMFRFSWIAGLHVINIILAYYLGQLLQIRWRRWLTRRYIGSWLGRQAYYRMQIRSETAAAPLAADSAMMSAETTDNPDQRIQQDLQEFVQLTLTLTLELLNQSVTLVTFIIILWGLSGSFTFTAFGTSVVIPGLLVWAAIVYAAGGTWLTHIIGRPLIGLNFNQQRLEADFRYSLVRLRENAEAVALYGGEARENEGFERRFGRVIGNWLALMYRRMRLLWLTQSYGQIAVVFPFVLNASRYFTKEIKLGQVLQTAQAFGRVQSALSFFVTAYPTLAVWRADVERLITFQRAIDEVRAAESGVAVAPSAGGALVAEDLDLALPDGAPLVRHAAFTVQGGEATLIAGPSGSGKSTLFRALAGIWPFAKGVLRLPAGAKIMFLPQRPYMPLGTLAECLSYPEPAAGSSDAERHQAMVDCGLESFVHRLDEEQNWGLVLSPGEQQRIAFARVLLKRPDWVFLDEATSALDRPLEQALYARLRQRLPDISIISIGHRPELAGLGERRLELRPSPDGARLEAAVAAAAT
jgi:vitamin B12/bleomycin/antimicrobial peptide transport system ATP-binding/permease protein